MKFCTFINKYAISNFVLLKNFLNFLHFFLKILFIKQKKMKENNIIEIEEDEDEV